MSDTTTDKLILFGVLIASVVLHELGHAASALAFGDDTARRAGRITLNPWKLSPFGAVILPGLLILVGSPPIAFASTPVNPRQMRNPKLHSLLCSLAGPAVNLLLVLVSVVVLRGVLRPGASVQGQRFVLQAAIDLGYVNVILGVFNLLPVPPLDGSAVVERFLPKQWWAGYLKLRQYGMGLLILVVFAVPNGFAALLRPFLRLWASSWTRVPLF